MKASKHNSKITTVKIERTTKAKLEGIREHRRETYSEIINKLLNIADITIRNPIAGATILRNLKRKASKKEKVYRGRQEKEQLMLAEDFVEKS